MGYEVDKFLSGYKLRVMIHLPTFGNAFILPEVTLAMDGGQMVNTFVSRHTSTNKEKLVFSIYFIILDII